MRDLAEDAAKQAAGNAVGRLIRWLGRRLGVKDRAATLPQTPSGFQFERRRGTDRRRPDE